LTEVLKPDEEGLKKAVEVIKRGGVIVYPTETFYGIGADPRNEEAIERIFQIKGRKKDMPILLIIGKKDMLYNLVKEVPDVANSLMNRFWPGPLTIIFQASKNVSPILHAGKGKIGIRLSGNPISRKISELSGIPITGTSANRSGMPPCRTVKEILSELKGIDLILDAGMIESQLPSTVIDVTEKPAKIIREGIISKEKIIECIGELGYA